LWFVRSEDQSADVWATDEDYAREKSLQNDLRAQLDLVKPWRTTIEYFKEANAKTRRGRKERKLLASFLHRIFENNPWKADQPHPVQCYIPHGVQHVPKIRSFRLPQTIEGSVYYSAFRKKYVEPAGAKLTVTEAVASIDPRFANSFSQDGAAASSERKQTMAEQVCASSVAVFEPDTSILGDSDFIDERLFGRQSSSDSENANMSPLHGYDGPAN